MPSPAAIKFMTSIHRTLFRASGGRVGSNMGGIPCLMLTTTGRTSGRPRHVPLLYLEHQGAGVVIASYGGNPQHPAWWLNLEAQPEATVQIGRAVHPVRARLADPGERQTLWAEAVAIYPPYDDYKQKTTREIPVVILEPRG